MPRPAHMIAWLLLASCAPLPTAEPRTEPWRTTAWQYEPIASAQFESHAAFDAKSRTLYFVRSSPAFSGWRILASICRDGHWSEPRPAAFAGDGVEADPFFSRDGDTLYFISTRSENGVKQAELDIWAVRRAGSGWGAPVRMPEPINSAGAEWFPRPATDGWLYFGSDRAGGLGRTDIYRARLRKGKWEVENLGGGVNGPGDEYEAEVSPDGRHLLLMADGDLYMVQRQGGGWGGRRKLGPEINTDGLEVGATFSPSGRSFLFSRDFGKAVLPKGGSGEFLVAAQDGSPEDWPTLCR